jgi:hypothetical protein
MPLPTPLYTTAQARALDSYAIDTLGVPGYTLMKRAGEAALRYLRTRWPTAHSIVIVCGGGNNGGDGYVLARFAQAAGLTVTVLAASPPEALRGDAQQACQDFKQAAGACSRSPRRSSRKARSSSMHCSARAFSCRASAGCRNHPRHERSGAAGLCARCAFGSRQRSRRGAGRCGPCNRHGVLHHPEDGLFVGDGPDFAGNVFFDDLEIAAPATPEFRPRLERITEAEAARALPPRARAANKGDFGHVLIVGGGVGMPGAVRLAGEACLRVGAGLVTVAVAPENVGSDRLRMPRAHLSSRHSRRRSC